MVRALDDVSFAVASGELVAVVGPNGSGKTIAVLGTLLGLEPPTAGRVLLDDHDVAAYTRRELAEKIGALPQRESCFLDAARRSSRRWARLLGPIVLVTAPTTSAR